MKINRKNIRFTLFALISLMLLIGGIWFVSDQRIFSNSNILFASIDDPIGLSTKSKVQINGVEIGKIKDFIIVDDNALLELEIDDEIEIRKQAQFYSVPSGLMGDRYIDVQNYNQGNGIYTDKDTLKNAVVKSSLKEALVINDEIEQKLKDFSRDMGTALLKYADSPSENCNTKHLDVLLHKFDSFPEKLNDKDVYLLMVNQCKKNVEYAELQNELIFKLLEIKPKDFIRNLEHSNITSEEMDGFYDIVENPISDAFDLDRILKKVNDTKESESKDRLIHSLRIANDKY